MEEEQLSTTEEETDDEEIVEVQGMSDFILPLSDNEEWQEALIFTTKRKSTIDFPQRNKKYKSSTSALKDKGIANKSSHKSNQTTPPQSNSSPPAKTLLVSNEIEYIIIEDMKKTRDNITFHELIKLNHQKNLFLYIGV